MKELRKHLGMTLLLISLAAAQGSVYEPVVLKDILVSGDNGRPKIELVLSAPVIAETSAATHPDRVIIELPKTIDGTNLPKMPVGTNGVRSVEIVRTPITPDFTRIVIELDRPLDCEVSDDEGHIAFTFMPLDSRPDSQGAVAAAKRGAISAIFHRDKDAGRTQVTTVRKTPPAATAGVLAGSRYPQAQVAPANTTTAHSEAVAPQSAAATQSAQPPHSVSSAPVSPTATVAQTATVAPISAHATTASENSTQTSNLNPVTTSKPNIADSKPPSTPAPPERNPSQANTAASLPEPLPPVPSQITAASKGEPEQAEASASEKLGRENADDPKLVIRAADPSLRTVFRVKYVAEGVAYLEGGRNAGLKEGTKLEIRDDDLPARQGAAVAPSDPRVVAELVVSAVAESSSVTDIHEPKRPVKVGDLAYLSSADADALVQATALSPTRKYPAVVSFTEGDPEDEDVRAEIPRPPLPSVNRARGRFGFDYLGTVSHGANSLASSSLGLMFRGDITRINGTYWTLSGYWRGRLSKESPAGQQTLQELINRTYHLSMTYDNPDSRWVAGFGRLYLPWANSLDTIDGGYIGRKMSDTGTVGMFAGSTPDPTSYDYAPNRSIGGAFINFTGGDFSGIHYSSTMGAGLSMLQWKPDRPFGFLENTISYTQRLSLYDALQVDSPAGNPAVAAPGPGLSRNFFTARIQATPRVEFDFNHTYFRDIPTFDPTLIGTGLLDKYLFQGFSAGARVEFIKNVTAYTQLGRSSRSGDASSSLNELYGITFARLPLWNLRADFHYARFNSAFGSGTYKAFSVSRSLTDNLHAELLTGQQSFNSMMTNPGQSWFVISNIETNFGPHYFLQGSFTTNRGQMSYDQWMFTWGYRFDSRGHRP